jgi:hypothetical protein
MSKGVSQFLNRVCRRGIGETVSQDTRLAAEPGVEQPARDNDAKSALGCEDLCAPEARVVNGPGNGGERDMRIRIDDRDLNAESMSEAETLDRDASAVAENNDSTKTVRRACIPPRPTNFA